MNDKNQFNELLAFFKALSDANRLKIVGLLAQSDYSGEELAAILALRPSTVSHHLARLSEVGLVSAQAQSYYNVYRLETGALQTMAQRLLADETLPGVTAGVDLDAYDRKVVENYSGSAGRLTSIPSKRKKFESILRYVSATFEPGRRYTEKEVNEILGQYHEDTAILRRGLVDGKLMSREPDGALYWLTES
ncbi:MAG TPA: metalloregulator ArsR/SmtB family transcription factor [Anaerolineae bacterium]|jgi:predicted transcriptional regulator|nr:metalloregulator ArsR/SmtB family transcription factor [Anaerolineae bacterium]